MGNLINFINDKVLVNRISIGLMTSNYHISSLNTSPREIREIGGTVSIQTKKE
jgi:hypothetical protein